MELTPVPSRFEPCSIAAARDVVSDWLASLSDLTRAAYSQDLADFARFLGAIDGREALRMLTEAGQAGANMTALRYRTHLVDRKLAPATINRRLAALRSAVGVLRVAGAIPWPLEVKPLKAMKYRDTRGPGVAGVRSLIRATGGNGEKSLRDRALLFLLFGMGLRRGEVVTLDVEHLDAAGKRLLVRGKARGGEREALTIPDATLGALQAYLLARGNPVSGPIFTGMSRALAKGLRITGEGIRRIVGKLGDLAGLGKVRPHGLRHASITAALDSGRDVRDVLRFSRHRDPRTLMIYDDNRQDKGGAVANVVTTLIG